MNTASDFASSVKGFFSLPIVEQLFLLAWYLESVKGRSPFSGENIRDCFRGIGLKPPDTSTYLKRQVEKRPNPPILKVAGGYKLSPLLRRQYDAKFLNETTVHQISNLLSQLPNKVPNVSERDFLQEAIKCYRVEAYRATIIMVWNLAFDHLCEWLLADQQRLTEFNLAIPRAFPKMKQTVVKRSDFDELKESETIKICRVGRILDKNICQTLEEKLGRRNRVAHPSRIVVDRAQADDTITDLVNNVVLTLTV